MKKSMRRIVGTLLAVCILTSGMGAFAAEERSSNPVSVMWTHTDFISAGLTIGKLGYATCSASLEITNSTDTGTLYMKLQRYSNGTWNDVYTWNTSGSNRLVLGENYYVTSGYTYRVHAIGYVYTGGTLMETTTQDSQQVYY